ncbi:MAG: hypothetical protein KKA73_06690 [Chloroflexi bacterium]|nr:hypothetical protein [Chloroflexota bacterium]MBU1747359.1 hypothetical protein [Chloroflexota bacterium]
MDAGRITIITGRFGSGKTEIAINYARQLAQERGRAALIDLDLVTPYFRSREMVDALAPANVQVVAPLSITRELDVPAITAEVLGTIQNPAQAVVIDVGGDPQGARALGQYASYLQGLGYDMWFAVNPFRPFTDTVALITTAIRDIERTSKLCVTGLISNPNLMAETTPNIVREGHQTVQEASHALNLAIVLVCVEERLADELDPADFGAPVLVLKRYFYPAWEL